MKVYLTVQRLGYAESKMFTGCCPEETHESKKEGEDQESRQSSPHLTQDTNWKVTPLQLDITNDSQEVSPFQAGDHKASINRRARKHNKNKTEKCHLNVTGFNFSGFKFEQKSHIV